MPFAEAIGVIASCVQLAELATKSIKNLRDLQRKFKEAANTLQLLSSQLHGIESAVKHIALWLDRSPLDSVWSPELRDDLSQSIEACGTTLQNLKDHTFRLNNESGTALLLERMKYVWKADELHEYQELLRDHVQALSFLLQVAQLPDRSEQHIVLGRTESRRIIEKPRDESSSLRWLKDEQSVGTPIEAVPDDLKRFSMAFDFDQEILNSRAYKSTLASFMRQRLQDSKETPPQSEESNADTTSVTLRDVLGEIDQELEAINTGGENHLNDCLSPADFEPLHLYKSSTSGILIDLDPIQEHFVAEPSTISIQNDLAGLHMGDDSESSSKQNDAIDVLADSQAQKRHHSLPIRITIPKDVSFEVNDMETSRLNRKSIDKSHESLQSKPEGLARLTREYDSLEPLRKTRSTPQVKNALGIHRSLARREKKRAHSDTDRIMTDQAVKSVDLGNKLSAVDELLALCDESAKGIHPDPTRMDELAAKLQTSTSFLQKLTPFNSHLNRGYIAEHLASRGGPQSELENYNLQARRLGHPMVDSPEFETFQKAWHSIDISGNRYIPNERLPNLIHALGGPFQMSIYQDHFTIPKISSHLVSESTTSDSLPSSNFTASLAHQLQFLPISRIHVRRKRLNFFFHECLFCADAVLGLNSSEVLKILTYYKDPHQFGDWKISNGIEVKRSIEREDSTLLERFIKRRARLGHIEELASIEMLKGWMETFYWRRRFKRYREARKKREDSLIAMQATAPNMAVFR